MSMRDGFGRGTYEIHQNVIAAVSSGACRDVLRNTTHSYVLLAPITGR
jgi:hypothetical protein